MQEHVGTGARSWPREIARLDVDEVVAFYVPQFHPTVDLRVPEVRAAQARLARDHGVTAFCYWHYWFAGTLVLDQVVSALAASGESDLPFCLGWGDRSWTGESHEAPERVVKAPTHPGDDDHRRHFDALLPLFAHERHLRVDGRPVFYVQDPEAIPRVEAWVQLWQDRARDAGLDGLFLVGEYRGGRWEPQHHGFDGSVAIRLPRPRLPQASRASHRGPTVVRYADVYERVTSLDDDEHFPCVLPRWDDTPRAGRRGLVLSGATPDLFREQVRLAVDKASCAPRGRRIIWVRSWNEWVEGSPVEPDRDHGDAYLEALRGGLASPRRRPPSRGEWWYEGRGVRARLARSARALEARPRRRDDPASAGAVPVVLCIDCEPDPRVFDPTDAPPFEGYVRVHEFLEHWRDTAERVTGAPVKLNWFFRMDPQIAESYGSASAFVDRHPAEFERLHDAGDGFGVHPHAWRWDRGRDSWVEDLADASWVRECLEVSVETFRDTVGRAPLLRFGDGFLDDALVDAADALGIRHDLTLEPGRSEHPVPETADGEIVTAWIPDHRRVPRHPYQPARADYRRAASRAGERSRAITLMPLSCGPRWLGSSVRGRLAARRDQGAGWRQRDILYLALCDWTGPDPISAMLRRTLDAQRRPYLALAIRTDWALRPDHRRNVERGLDALLAQHERNPLVFCTPDQACSMLGVSRPDEVSRVDAGTVASLRGSVRTR
jgi:hypothetical protein